MSEHFTSPPQPDRSAPAAPRVARLRALRWPLTVSAGVLVVILIAAAALYFVSRSVDSDGDGLSDYVEATGWRTTAGDIYITDPGVADTDGDGLDDGYEAGDPVEGSGSDPLYLGVTDPTKGDSDDDGLGDEVEVATWRSDRGAVYRTDPWNPDTDGDGLGDGDEAGAPSSDANGDIEFEVFSDPTVGDTDRDGLSDAVEADLSLDAFAPDTDGDRLGDAEEVLEVGTAPDLSDTDGDGFDDGYEVENQASQGLDPLWPDVKVDTAVYARDFAEGAVLGEFAPGDSLAWFAGNLASGSASFIPGIGWVIGGAADLRDALASTIQADWVGAGLSVAGLVPIAGDIAAVPAKTAKFVARHPEFAATVGTTIVSLKWVPDSVKVSALRSASPEDWDFLVHSGVSSSTLAQLQKGNVSASTLAAAVRRDGHRSGDTTAFFRTPGMGEEFLAELYGADNPAVVTQLALPTRGCIAVCNATTRRVDVFADGVAHESKVGRVYLTESIQKQILSDAYLAETGAIDSAHWHFFASSVTNTLGPSVPVMDLLDSHGIAYTIHLPK